jgi:hypothetical protein
MQPLDQFMRDYFLARIAEEERELRSRAAYRRKFFTAGCFFDSREGTIEMIKSEHVIRSTASDETGEVITVITDPSLAGSPPLRHRYLLTPSGESWLISEVQLPCYSCGGEPGNDGCMLCHGKGWLSTQFGKGKRQ